jgi:hypothetical protein
VQHPEANSYLTKKCTKTTSKASEDMQAHGCKQDCKRMDASKTASAWMQARLQAHGCKQDCKHMDVMTTCKQAHGCYEEMQAHGCKRMDVLKTASAWMQARLQVNDIYLTASE